MHLLKINFWLLLFLLVSCSGGNDNKQKQQSVKFNKYIFALMYENAAWGDRQKGLFINNNGDLYYYINTSSNSSFILSNDSFSSSELNQYFETTAVFLSHIAPDVFSSKKALVDSIKNGPFSSLEHTCFDAGDFRYYAFDYNSETDSYEPILIYRAGDFREKNNNPQIDKLKLWLMNFGLQNDIVFDLNPGEDNVCTGM